MDSVTRALMDEYSKSIEINELPEDKRFEYFSAYCVVSGRYSDEFEVQDLVVGSGADLCVDSFAILANGRLANDSDFITDIMNVNGYLNVEFVIVQSKTSSRFEGSEIIALGDHLVNEVFAPEQSLPANDDVQQLINMIKTVYKNATKFVNNPICRVYYVTTGNWVDDQYLTTVINRKKEELLASNMFSEVHFEAIGARKLQDLYRDTKKSISREIKFEKLVTLPEIAGVVASYLGVLPATEFIKLITDSDGNIVKSVFVDNVRDFQGENEVNRDITQTILEGLFDQFVLRNNGITIVAKEVKVTSNNFTLHDYQIVNGCQTSHVLYSQRSSLTEALLVPLKLIYTSTEDVTQSVIKSTNKQTPVDENDLLALTKFQRDLEDYYGGMPEEMRLFYERRAKQYAGKTDIEKGRITSIGSQLKSFASMFLEQPNQAGRYQGTLLKSVKDQVFRANHKPEAYYTAAITTYRFEKLTRGLVGEERKIKPFRYYLILAFRHRYESADFQGADNKKTASYCKLLNDLISDQDLSKTAFDECREIVKLALSNLQLLFERDSAKSKPLAEETKKIAIERRLALKKVEKN